MEQLGSLPAPETVLNKLKSDGTFDQLRKSCLAAIEEEPSFRAHGENVEILSRRYLTDLNWKDGTSKNEARARLKNYVLGVIASPELQVGMPLGALVEKALESKRKELQPKISGAVESLRISKPPTTETTAGSSSTEVASSKRGSTELGGLSLPIEIPGLSAPKKEPGGVGGDAKPPKGKQKMSEGSKDGVKIKTSDPATLKDASKSVLKVKTITTSIASKSAAVKDVGKVKEEKVATDKETAGEEKLKTALKSKKIKEEAVKPTAQREDKDTVQKPQVTANKEEKNSEVKMDATKKEAEETPSEPDDKITEGKEPDVQTPTEVEPPNSKEGPVIGSRKRKQLPPTRRRSARLASKDDDKTEPESNSEEQKPKDVVAAAASSDKDPDTSEGEDTAEDHGRKRARGVRVKTSGRKKARVFSSSSEESDGERSGEGGCESETEHPKEEEKLGKRRRGSRKGGVLETEVASGKKGSRKRAVQEESKSSKKMKKDQAKSKEKQKLQKYRLMSPVVVVTRYNRRVKRNRRYSPSGELSDTESSVQEEPVGKQLKEDNSSDREEEEVDGKKLDSSRLARKNGRTK